jgi:hypothetical protein
MDDQIDTSVVLRVSHAQLDLDACLRWLPSSKLIRVWRSGEKHRRGDHEASGFAVDLAEGPARGSVVQDAVDAFLELAGPVAELVRGGAHAAVDFGLFLDARGGGSLCLSFAPVAAAVFERAGVTLQISAYPTSGDGDDDDD